jgi:hypothetical protein
MARLKQASDATGQFIEHLRSVHFALVATCFALLVAASLKPPGAAEKAYNQVMTAAGVADKVFTLEVLDRFSRRRNAHFRVEDNNYQVLAGGRDLADQVVDALPRLLGVSPGSLDGSGWRWDAAIKSNGNFWPVRYWREPEIQGTLGGFRKAWDFYANAKAVRVEGQPRWDGTRFFLLGKDLEPAAARASAAAAGRDRPIGITDLKLGLREERDARRQLAPRRWYVVLEPRWSDNRNSPAFDEIWVPVPARKDYSVDPQMDIVPTEAGLALAGPFEDAFGDLAEQAKGLESLEMGALIAYLRQRYRENDKAVQLLGIEVPQSAISQWGLLVLIACLAYLLLHLRRARRLWREPLPASPWIALYQDRLSRLVSLGSITLIPVSAGGLLIVNGWSSSASPATRAALAGGGLLALVLVYGCVASWPVATGLGTEARAAGRRRRLRSSRSEADAAAPDEPQAPPRSG